jgi:hypothetical protein
MARAKSVDGRAVARFNAATHGLTAETPVIPGVERQEDWDAFRTALVECRAPVGALELELAERIASLLWRLRRPARYEREYIAASIERVPEDFLTQPLKRSLPRTLAQAAENIENAQRCLRLLEDLPGMDITDWIDRQDAGFILEAVTRHDDLLALKRPLPGFEQGLARVDEDWTPPLLLLAFRALAGRYGTTVEDLLADTVAHAQSVAAEREEEREAMLAEQDRMRRERTLPEASTLHALTRYEASLHRMLIQTMHELEAAQARRTGHPAPLARVDLQLLEKT